MEIEQIMAAGGLKVSRHSSKTKGKRHDRPPDYKTTPYIPPQGCHWPPVCT
jgi:hypothetical protein